MALSVISPGNSSADDYTNYSKIARCIFGPATELLREVLRDAINEEELKFKFSNNPNLIQRLSIEQKKLMRIDFRTNMFSDIPNYNRFDMCFLRYVLKNELICTSIEPPTNGWGYVLAQNGKTMGDDIERLCSFRHKLVAHNARPMVDRTTFSRTINQLVEICQRMALSIKSNTEYHKNILEIKGMDMGQNDRSKEMAIISKMEKMFDRIFSVDNNTKSRFGQSGSENVVCCFHCRPHIAQIISNYRYLLKEIPPMKLLPALQKKGIISEKLHQEIKDCVKAEHKTDKILKSLLLLDPSYYDDFLEVVRSVDEAIVIQLENTEEEDASETFYDRDQDSFKRRLDHNKESIDAQMDALDLLHECFEKRIISIDKHTRILYEDCRSKRNELFMNCIDSLSSYAIFMSVLKTHSKFALLHQQIEHTDLEDIHTVYADMPPKQFIVKSYTIKEGEKLEISPKAGAAIKVLIMEDGTEIPDQELNVVIRTGKGSKTGESALGMHGLIEKVEKGCLKITLSAASPLFHSKIKSACKNGDIAEFFKTFLVGDFVKNKSIEQLEMKVTIRLRRGKPGLTSNAKSSITAPRFHEFTSDFAMFQQILMEEVNVLDMKNELVKHKLLKKDDLPKIFDKNLCSSKRMEKIVETMKETQADLQQFVTALAEAGYQPTADVISGKHLQFFANMSPTDLRFLLVINFQLLLDEVDSDKLIACSAYIERIFENVKEKSYGNMRSKMYLLLKAIFSREDDRDVLEFFKSLNFAGYRNILKTLRETALPELNEDNEDEDTCMTEEIIELHLGYEDQLRIVLLGKPGVGKSSTGNTILGRKAFVEDVSAAPVTKECQVALTSHLGKYIKVIDTPDFATQEESKAIANKCLHLASPGPHIFLFVLRIGRLTLEDVNCAHQIQKYFGQNVSKNIVVVFTGKDYLEQNNKTFCDFLSSSKQDPYLAGLITEFPIFAIDNLSMSEKERENIIKEIFAVAEPGDLQLNCYKEINFQDSNKSEKDDEPTTTEIDDSLRGLKRKMSELAEEISMEEELIDYLKQTNSENYMQQKRLKTGQQEFQMKSALRNTEENFKLKEDRLEEMNRCCVEEIRNQMRKLTDLRHNLEDSIIETGKYIRQY